MPTHTVVFDFDKTIISSDATTELILRLILRNPLRIALAVLFTPVYFCLLRSFYGRYAGAKVFLFIAQVGHRKRTLVKLEREFYDSVIYKKNRTSFLYNDALETINRYSKDGFSIVILSASPERVVRSILLPCLKPYDVKVKIIGTRSGIYCFGENKILVAKNKGLIDWLACYTDSAHDFPILERAKNKFLVNPNQRTRIRAKNRFNSDIKFLNWS